MVLSRKAHGNVTRWLCTHMCIFYMNNLQTYHTTCCINVILSPFNNMRPGAASVSWLSRMLKLRTKLSSWLRVFHVDFGRLVDNYVHELVESLLLNRVSN